MKIVDESILFFSRVSLLKILFGSSLHFVGIRVFIVGCVWNVKSQLQVASLSCELTVWPD